ncbi:enoyl-CoA hydratase/isomerase [Pseudomonas batumici]|uniref:BatD, batumin synthesis operon, methylglutaconyl-CoA hydratase n=1 Tax=Pseudomonas batumici TaxID=226910 RepID=A0A0C2IG38_9PSED|nr:enoyl-CoA hydratase/isomerase [Pseudomonas batumici]KIH86010.1 BatD, batumin synthesis operon, methylglutaconyl-CoA hydratase [Pseudomonas batumici]
MSYQTIKVRFEESICFLQLDRLESANAINGQLVAECSEVLSICQEAATVVVLSGSPEAFCVGADFGALADPATDSYGAYNGPGPLYDLWLKLATGPYVTVAHVRGKANAGGIGFVAACDIVLADATAQFSLSELLFGLYPACVLPFLIRRISHQRAHYLTLMTHPISAEQAFTWGLVDALESDSEALLRRHLLRLRRLSKVAVTRYKDYMSTIGVPLAGLKSSAIAGNLEVFSDPANLKAIIRYVESGVFPWEKF